MTKEEFEVLQLELQQSGKSIKLYLQEAGIVYSTYNYWRKKLEAEAKPVRDLAPISFTGRQYHAAFMSVVCKKRPKPSQSKR